MVDVFELADYLLLLDREKSSIDGDDAQPDITPLKLQKLLYYCQGYSLGMFGELLFGNDIQAWNHGPVIPEVYDKYGQYKSSAIFLRNEDPDIDDRAKQIARIVMQDKGRFAPWALSDMTHKEQPWRESYVSGCKNQIPAKAMREFFSSIFDEELPSAEEEELLLRAGARPTMEEWREIKNYAGGI
ncbi:MAG: DUF4065 domain-containing protein [Synergistaceae bacterium]|jgi:uncharacterized phage-associated protein|nr:DUF4065 domain-containing protein [Synergistaceae bacterium]